MASGARLDLNGYGQTIGSLAGAGSVALGARMLTTGGDNTSTLFSGVIDGNWRFDQDRHRRDDALGHKHLHRRDDHQRRRTGGERLDRVVISDHREYRMPS